MKLIRSFVSASAGILVAVAALVALVPPLLMGGDWQVWIYKGLAILLIGCPCALVISTPAAIAAGLSAGARRGLLIKGGAVIEAEIERTQSDTPSLKPWPAQALPDVLTRFILFRDDRFFPERFMRGVVADRLGVEPEVVPGGHMAMLSHPGELADRLTIRAERAD